MRQQEQQQLAEEQLRTSALILQKQELEEKLAAMSRTSSGFAYLLRNIKTKCFKFVSRHLNLILRFGVGYDTKRGRETREK